MISATRPASPATTPASYATPAVFASVATPPRTGSTTAPANYASALRGISKTHQLNYAFSAHTVALLALALPLPARVATPPIIESSIALLIPVIVLSRIIMILWYLWCVLPVIIPV
jgi:hypothetical protein